MFDWSRWSGRRRRKGLRLWLHLVTALCALAMTLPAATSAGAQPPTEESTEEATILLMPYLLQDDDAPAGYALTTTTAYPNDAEAFESVMIPPPDPRPMEVLLTRTSGAGRLVRITQGFENSDDADAPDLYFSMAAFRDASAASRALQDPGLLTFVLPDAKVAAVAAPTFGTGLDGVSAHSIDQTTDEDKGEQRSMLLSWQRGRVVFSTMATGTTDSATAALVTLVDLATHADTRIASRPAFPAQVAAAPAFMGTAARRLELYQALNDRLPDDDAFGDIVEGTGVSAIPNSLIVLDSQIADASMSDARVVADRLLKSERHILGTSKRYEPSGADYDKPSTRFPAVTVGQHLYADADGAHEAFGAPLAEMGLRVNEEIYLLNEPTQQVLADARSARTIGDQPRTLTSTVTIDDDTKIELTSVRWRRGAVEFYANVAVPAGTDSSALVQQAVEKLDGAYTSRPLQGF